MVSNIKKNPSSKLKKPERKLRNQKKGKYMKFKKKGQQFNQKEKRGAVYIGNLPHGFYEKSLWRFFSQFGEITRSRVARSQKNAKPMGWAYIEFRNECVAKIVSKTMNRYLIYDKLLKTNFISSTNVNDKMFRNTRVTRDFCQGTRGKIKDQFEREKDRCSSFETKKKEKISKVLNFMNRTLGLKVKSNLEEKETSVSEEQQQQQLQSPSEEKKLQTTTTTEVKKRKTPLKEKKTSQIPKDTEQQTPSEKRLSETSSKRKSSLPLEKRKKRQTPIRKQPQTPSEGKPLTIEIDEVDEEIIIKTPPNVVKKVKGKRTVICDDTATTLERTPKKRYSASLEPVTQNIFDGVNEELTSSSTRRKSETRKRKLKGNENEVVNESKNTKLDTSTNVVKLKSKKSFKGAGKGGKTETSVKADKIKGEVEIAKRNKRRFISKQEAKSLPNTPQNIKSSPKSLNSKIRKTRQPKTPNFDKKKVTPSRREIKVKPPSGPLIRNKVAHRKLENQKGIKGNSPLKSVITRPVQRKMKLRTRKSV